MRVLLWIVRIYEYWMIAWALMSWIPGVAGSPFHQLIGIPIIPVLNLFSFLHLGPIGLQAIIPLALLMTADQFLTNRVQAAQGAAAGQPLPRQMPLNPPDIDPN